ncbi:MAG: DUF1638 domain-containing protein [Deltaproteobacteria bacterium]|nr:DUF1638 domain-containing protein [Deltaproteobacteria bacterium]
MSTEKPACLIACGVLARDIRHLVKKMGLNIHTHFLPGGLHNNPQQLKGTLQDFIDDASRSDQWNRIVIGYGVCGLGTVHLQARGIPLVLPKVHDCIALFLGGDKIYREQFHKFPGTYYVSAGWVEENKDTLATRKTYTYAGDTRVYFDDLVNKYGDRQARNTFSFLNSWQRNYQRAAFIDTGRGDTGQAAERARQMAKEFNWKYETLPGDLSLLTKLLTTESTTDEILVVLPGQVTTFNPVEGGLSSGPPMESSQKSGNDRKKSEWIEGTEHTPLDMLKIGLGIDAGGTYTDAVIYDFEQGTVLDKQKAPTTKWNFSVGVGKALAGLDQSLLRRVQLTAVSTTLATNAIVEDEGQKVGLLLMPPEGNFLEMDFPHEPKAMITGRLGIDGEEIEPFDESQVRGIIRKMIDQMGVKAFAVSGYAGSINPEHELAIKKIIQDETGLFVSCGHELSSLLNFRTRAQTAVMNARIVPRIRRLVENIEKVLVSVGIDGPIMVVKGDGTLMASSLAMERPVETVLSGPAASVAGARFLTGAREALVVDMGGTTTDLAAVEDNKVQICESGAKIGSVQTHVLALKIRTTGLGGDSLISFHEGAFSIGPRRVTPIAWLGRQFSALDDTFAYLNKRFQQQKGSSHRTLIIALTEYENRMPLSDSENRIVELLQERPYSLDELVEKTGVLYPGALALSRLEEYHIVQQSGLTPTDLLHFTGEFTDWDTHAAKQMSFLTARLSGLDPEKMVEQLLKQIMQRLVLELIKKQLDEDTDPDKLEECDICRLMLTNLIQKDSKNYSFYFQLHKPVIGIGAPIGYFLPQAAKLLNTEAMLPENGDVANAIGAITSHVAIQKHLTIIPDQRAGFSVKGISGGRSFRYLKEAHDFAVGELCRIVIDNARLAGTSQTAVRMQSNDRTIRTAKGDEVFLERQISAELSGVPDLLLGASQNRSATRLFHRNW